MKYKAAEEAFSIEFWMRDIKEYTPKLAEKLSKNFH